MIRRKRAEAELALGAAFDKRYFHDTILALRSVPLTVLAQELDRWIAAGGPNPFAGHGFSDRLEAAPVSGKGCVR